MALSAAASFAVACSTSPPPKPVEPKPIEAAVSPPPSVPTPTPKPCKALDEQCEATGATRAKVAGGELSITPAKAWTYAQGDSATLAQASDNGPAIALAQVELGDARQETAKREAALEALAKEVKVTLPKKKVNWKKPDETKDVAGMKVGLWQVEGAARVDKKGPLLIFSTFSKEVRTVLGFGFVPDDDKSKADETILQSIESIGE